ncbi:hypothetical protein V1283_008296 [Bradyrhizobium sp. AZCC 2262]|uniref:hypothetical protein n=1 Tax=Bradyrhizobium sp. AZCC 2262 TaxID=3117022 RepID=UPI002FEE9707
MPPVDTEAYYSKHTNEDDEDEIEGLVVHLLISGSFGVKEMLIRVRLAEDVLPELPAIYGELENHAAVFVLHKRTPRLVRGDNNENAITIEVVVRVAVPHKSPDPTHNFLISFGLCDDEFSIRQVVDAPHHCICSQVSSMIR